MAQKDYPELEGKTVHYIDNDKNSLETVIGKVVGCNFDIGLTVVNKNNPDEYLLCLTGPMSKAWKNSNDKIGKKIYKALFYSRIAQIKKGHIKAETAHQLYKIQMPDKNIIFGTPSADSCAFS